MKANSRRRNLLILALKGKSEVLNLIGQGKKALKEMNRGIALAKEVKDKKLIADCILAISNIYNSLSQGISFIIRGNKREKRGCSKPQQHRLCANQSWQLQRGTQISQAVPENKC